MTASVEHIGDSRRVYIVVCADAHLEFFGFRLGHRDGDLDAVHVADKIDDALRVPFGRAGCGKIVGTSAPCVSENLAKVTALANAANEYAIIQGGNVRGRIVNTASSLSGQQIDNIVASFERLVNKDIRGELVPYASFYKAKGSLYTARVYCIVDEDAAARARRHAMELALEEQALTEKYGSLVSDWIDEGFWKASEE